MINNLLCVTCGNEFQDWNISYVCPSCQNNIKEYVKRTTAQPQNQSLEDWFNSCVDDCAICDAEEQNLQNQSLVDWLDSSLERCDCGDCNPEDKDLFTLGYGIYYGTESEFANLVNDIIESNAQEKKVIPSPSNVKEKAKEAVKEFKTLADKTIQAGSKNEVQRPKTTLVVNLFPGPGTGKSTIAAGVFNRLKWKGIRAELALEYAKDLVWEERKDTFRDQIYMFGKMYHRIFRLLGKVDVVITDSPILLTPIYDEEHRVYLEKLALDEHWKMNTLNIFLNRTKEYDPLGRNQDAQGAVEVDRKVKSFLDQNSVPYEVMDAYDGVEGTIAIKILRLLGKLPDPFKK